MADTESSKSPGFFVTVFGGTALIILATYSILAGLRDYSSSFRSYESRYNASTLPAPVAPKSPDTNAFNEQRDGSNTLSLEDQNGVAEVWRDTKTGARFFCHGSAPCLLLPPQHTKGTL